MLGWAVAGWLGVRLPCWKSRCRASKIAECTATCKFFWKNMIGRGASLCRSAMLPQRYVPTGPCPLCYGYDEIVSGSVGLVFQGGILNRRG